MTATLDGVTKRMKKEPIAEEQPAVELVAGPGSGVCP
jgi:hypothetical protein